MKFWIIFLLVEMASGFVGGYYLDLSRLSMAVILFGIAVIAVVAKVIDDDFRHHDSWR